jgi:hypothetical protein
MRKLCLLLLLAIPCPWAALGQVKRTSVPLGDAVTKALAISRLTEDNARPFHIRIVVSEPENPQSPYTGAIEQWWVSAKQYRREVTSKDGMHQTIVVAKGVQTERDEGEYFPHWLREFVIAAFDPISEEAVAAFTATHATIDQITMPNGQKSNPCARFKLKVGSPDSATDFFSNVCFDGEGRLQFYGTPGFGMEFHDYHGFGSKQFPRLLSDDPESGTHLTGQVQVLEDESKDDKPDLFTPLATSDDRFVSAVISTAQLNILAGGIPPIAWPTVRSGNTSGNLSIYIVTDAQGRVREAWPLTGDNGELHDYLRDQARVWQLRPAIGKSGKAVQVEGSISYHFETKIGKPLPVVTGAEVQKQLLDCPYSPTLPAGLLPSGKTFTIHIAVNEDGKQTGTSFGHEGEIPWKAYEQTGLTSGHCHFKPFLEDGKPTYYFMEFKFTAP